MNSNVPSRSARREIIKIITPTCNPPRETYINSTRASKAWSVIHTRALSLVTHQLRDRARVRVRSMSRAKVPHRKYYLRAREGAASSHFGDNRKLTSWFLAFLIADARARYDRPRRRYRSCYTRGIPCPLALNLLTRLRDARFQLAGRYMRDRPGPRLIIRADFNRRITTYPRVSPHPRVTPRARTCSNFLAATWPQDPAACCAIGQCAISGPEDTQELVIRVLCERERIDVECAGRRVWIIRLRLDRTSGVNSHNCARNYYYYYYY